MAESDMSKLAMASLGAGASEGVHPEADALVGEIQNVVDATKATPTPASSRCLLESVISSSPVPVTGH
jgi:hypothetical protein